MRAGVPRRTLAGRLLVAGLLAAGALGAGQDAPAAEDAPAPLLDAARPDAEGLAALRERRLGYLARWRSLEDDPALSGPERLGRLVQAVTDDALRRAGGGPLDAEAERAAERALLDDLVDLFVQDAFRREKALVMLSPSVLEGETVAESADDLAGFAPRFRAGDGRFRHFAMNAAAAYLLPDALVDRLARRVGGDEAEAVAGDPTGDGAADLATNEVGRAFAALLRSAPLADLADGRRVAVWIESAFGAAP